MQAQVTGSSLPTNQVLRLWACALHLYHQNRLLVSECGLISSCSRRNSCALLSSSAKQEDPPTPVQRERKDVPIHVTLSETGQEMTPLVFYASVMPRVPRNTAASEGNVYKF